MTNLLRKLFVGCAILFLSPSVCGGIIRVVSDNDIPELKYLNTSVDPCENFYEFTCGNFKNIHPRPSDALIRDHFTILEDQLISLAKEILETPNLDHEPEALKKARAAYSACMDLNFSNTILNPELEIIKAVNGFPLVTNLKSSEAFTWNDLGDLVSEYGIPMIFNIIAQPHSFDATKTIIYLKNESLPIPTLLRGEYAESHEERIEKELMAMSLKPRGSELLPFDIFLRNLTLKLRHATNNDWVSDDELYKNIDDMALFMRTMYAGGIIEDDANIPEFVNITSITVEGLQTWTDTYFHGIQINWLEYLSRVFKNAGIKIEQTTQLMVYNNMSTTLYGILNHVAKTDPNIIKNFALMRIFLYMAPDSDASTRAAFEEYYTKINRQLYPRWEYCTRKIIDSVGTASISYAVAYAYQRYHFNINKLSKAVEMITDLQESFLEMILEADWMDEEDKLTALRKVDKMITLLGYPEISENKTSLDQFYENLRICKWDNYGNSVRLRAFKQAYQLSSLGKTRDREIWDKSPFDVNAYYNRPNNKIIFPMAVLNPVFFNGNISVLDYSRIGSVIGHEITHGFDQQGSLYSDDGIIEPWWTTYTRKGFSDATSCFVKQYFNYPIDDVNTNVNGTLTLNENIADNGGLRVAHRAVQKLDKRRGSFRTRKYNADQLFFIGYGTLWCADASLQYISDTIKTNSHAVSKWRVNGVVSNMAEFATTFNCPVGSAMNPENRCQLW